MKKMVGREPGEGQGARTGRSMLPSPLCTGQLTEEPLLRRQ